jgi:rhamnosyltransferase
LVVDSGSTDGTDGLARRYGAAVHRIEKQEFNHGATRNLGISLARGDFVALMVQDAMPLDERWLAAMVRTWSGTSGWRESSAARFPVLAPAP